MRIFFINLKQNILPIAFLMFTLLLVVFSKSNILAVKNGINIWFNNLVPSLFPFFIAVELLNHTNIPNSIGKLFNKIMQPLFNVPGIGAYALFMGIISGYPVGAKIVTDLRNNNLCTKKEGERLLTFTNNSGPLFIIGSVGISLFNDFSIGILLLFTHLLACISVAFVFKFWKPNTRNTYSNYAIPNKTVTFSNLGDVISKSILNAIKSIFLIGGFVVLFNIIISLLNKLMILNVLANAISPIFNFINVDTRFLIPILSGFIELTSGINLISLIHTSKLGISVIITSFLLGFGGLSIILQVWSIISKSDLSIRPYIIGKFLQGIFASIYTYIIICNFAYFKYLLII